MAGSPGASRWPRRLLVAAGVFALLVIGGYLALVFGFPPERVAALASEQVSARTGREFRIDGKLAWRVLPRIAVVADGVVLGNAPWGSRKEMLRVEHAALDLEPWPLLRGEIKVGSVELTGVDLLLETDRAGNGNWVIAAPRKPETEPGASGAAARTPAIDALRLRDVKVTYLDRGARHELALSRLDLDRNDAGNRVEAQWALKAQRWHASGQLGPLAALVDNATDWPFGLELQTEGARIVAKGRLLHGAAPRTARVDLDARLDKASALAPWTDSAGRVPLPLELKATIAAAGETVKADPLALSIAGQSIAGRATWRSGDPWQLDANLKGGNLDLARVMPRRDAGGGGDAKSAAADGSVLFGDDKLPLDTLPTAIAKIDLRLDQLRLPDAPPLSGVVARIELDPGVLRAAPLSFGVAGGQVRGGVTLDAGTPARVKLRVDANGLSAEELARAGGNAHVGGGRVQLATSLAMRGNTPRALAASADGDLLLSIKDMTLADGAMPSGASLLPRLLQIVRPQRGAATATSVQCAVARLAFQGGVAAVDRTIAAETSDLTFSASGRIDLRDQTMELAIRPASRAGGAQLASLVVAKGPLLDPRLTIDARGAANLALSIGAAAASGGLSAIGKSLLQPASDPHPCVYAATGVAAKAPPAPAAAKGGARPAEGKADEVKKLLRGLFK